MKAAVFHRPHEPLAIEDLDLDGPGAGEARVKLVGAGVCHSDYHRIDGHMGAPKTPYVMGHEGAGVVEAVGTGVEGIASGDHVIFSLAGQCGWCLSCTRGRPNLCESFGPAAGRADQATRFSRDAIPYHHGFGTFAEETVVRAGNLVKVRDDVPLEKACLIGCSVMTGVGAVVNRARVEPGSAVAVFGCGGVGLNVVQGAAIAGASRIIAVDKVDFKLDKAREFGATHTVNAELDDPVARVNEISGGGADYAFEVVGSPGLLRQAFEALRTGGTAVMVGVPPVGADVSVDGRELFMDRTLMGTFYGSGRPRSDFPWLLQLYVDGRLKLDELMTRLRPLEEVNEAFEDMNRGVTARTVLTFD